MYSFLSLFKQYFCEANVKALKGVKKGSGFTLSHTILCVKCEARPLFLFDPFFSFLAAHLANKGAIIDSKSFF